MDLREFISETLAQIADGVRDAQQKTAEHGVVVNPALSTTDEEGSKHGLLFAGEEVASVVQFDVALTVFEAKGTKGGIGIFAGAVSLGSAGQSQAEHSSVSRIRFSVPMSLPRPKA